MADEYIISFPVIKSVTLSSNPVSVGKTYTVSIVVEEQTRVLTPRWPYSGTVYSGLWPYTKQ
jgi:hypothetical protein